MATLQKFKYLATQCVVAAGSPTRSPTTSPLIHLRRRKTLRMLLTSRGGGDDHISGDGDSPDKGKEMVVKNKLKDLFVSSPESLKLPEYLPVTGGGIAYRKTEIRSVRPVTTTFRQRLLRRVWRPMLVSIPE